MPLLRIETSVNLERSGAEDLIARASQAIAGELGKPERYVMVTVETSALMVMAGTVEPAANLKLKSIDLPDDRTGALSRVLCELIERAIGVPQDRVYITFADIPRAHWGWNGGTF